MKFVYSSEFSKKRIDMLNLRTDVLEREEDEQEYDRLMRIFIKPEFAASMRSCRCVVLVDAFLVTSPDNTTYVIHMQNKERPFAIAGIYANWLNIETNLYETGFTIITAASNPMLRRIGVEDMPVILSPPNVSKWLDFNLDRRQYLALIHTFPDDLMRGYPVSGKIFSGNLTSSILQPIGQTLKPNQVQPANDKEHQTEKQTAPAIWSYRKHKEKPHSEVPWFETRRKVE